MQVRYPSLITLTTALSILIAPVALYAIDQQLVAERAKMPSDESIKLKAEELRPEIEAALKAKPIAPTVLPETGYARQTIDVTPQDSVKEKRAVRDVMAAIQQLQKKTNDPEEQAKGDTEELLVFLSFSMPDQMIKQYIEQAARHKARVVFRGSVTGDLKISENQKRIHAMNPRRMASVEINPTLFTRYAVTKVPTFAVGKYSVTPGYDANGCLPPINFATITGDISIPYALKEIQNKGPDQIKPLATRYLNEVL